MDTAAVIPAYEPDEKLESTARALALAGFDTIVVVDDGSSAERQRYFGFAGELPGCVLLRHPQNRGKGRALKTAFRWLLDNRPKCPGAVTLDSDGQHRPADALLCAEALEAAPESLILGTRDFSLPQVPAKSRMGNRLTSWVFTYCCGMRLSDTQTGLRAVPRSFMERLMDIPGDRYEFETNMLLEAKERGVPVIEVPVDTVYYENNRASHFRPVADSWRVYRPLLKFFSSSIVCAALDIALFALINALCADIPAGSRYLAATAGARTVSSLVNYTLNRRMVFRSHAGLEGSILRYYLLAGVQMLASWWGVWALTGLLPLPATPVKLLVDTLLFSVSYKIQQKWVFRR